MKIASLRNMLWKERANALAAASVLELIILTLLLPGSGLLFHPQDPFFLQFHFPILLLPPLLLALRYGLALGMTSFAIILLAVTGAYFYQIGNIGDYPRELLFGTLVLTLLAGEMTNYLQAKIRRNQAELELLTLRFGEFTSSYHVMKVSHDQLKEQLATAKFSLREALQLVREKLHAQCKEGQRGLNQQIGNELLSIFNYFCSTQVAGVYLVEASGAVASQPLAVQGSMGELREEDQLIRQALAHGTMVSILPEMQAQKSKGELESDLLAVIPIKDISGHLWGIVAVAEMNFSAFQAENLNLMQLIGSYTGNLLSQADNIFYAPDDRQAFIGELENTWRLAKEFDITSSLICITFRQKIPPADYLAAILNRIRGVDHGWLHSDEKKQLVICLLMPLMAESEYLNFRKSLDDSLHDRFGQSVAEAGGVFHHLEIQGNRQLDDYVSFIAERVNDNPSPLPAALPPAVEEAIAAIPNLERELAAINLANNYKHSRRLSRHKPFYNPY